VRFGVLRFPGSCDEVDALLAARRVGEAEILWHGDRDLKGVDAVIVPGGFSYGDYLRAGAIARFSPAMESVITFARQGGMVLGICNGFQVLCEAQLLPGALLPNLNRRFTFRQVELRLVSAQTPFTSDCPASLSIPAKHAWGRWYAPPETVRTLRDRDQIVMRYAPGQNFNGSVDDVAGVCNERRNVFGLMPHVEHAVDALTGSTDGLCVFESMRLSVEAARA
jgi:phosphoribosylformylglycinamidine synthase